jgi:CheY-like chemotaxis protein
MRTILVVGEDEALQNTRSALLRQVGTEVLSASVANAARTLTMRRFDLVVICHSLSLEEKIDITTLAHRPKAGTRVLQLVCPHDKELNEEHIADVSVGADPKTFVDKVTELLHL